MNRGSKVSIHFYSLGHITPWSKDRFFQYNAVGGGGLGRDFWEDGASWTTITFCALSVFEDLKCSQ